MAALTKNRQNLKQLDTFLLMAELWRPCMQKFDSRFFSYCSTAL